MSTLRRFIAGARCPRCEALDTLALAERDGDCDGIGNFAGIRKSVMPWKRALRAKSRRE